MRRTVAAVAGICVMAAVGGYFLGGSGNGETERERPGIGAAMGDENRGQRRGVGGGGAPNRGRWGARGAEPLTAERREALKEDLLRSYRYAGSPEHDWVLREETASMLAAFSNQELEEFAREIAERAGFLEPIDRQRQERDNWNLALLNEVFAQWGLRDPAAACLAMPVLSIERTRILEDWLKRDPEAAEAWIQGGGLMSESASHLAVLHQSYLSHLAERDLAAAGRELASLDEEARGRAWEAWSKKFANRPEKRAELLALLSEQGDEKLIRKYQETILVEIALKSPAEAYDFLDELDLPEEDLAELSDVATGRWALQEPQEAFAAWIESEPESLPEPMARALENWSLNSPGAEQAVEWVSRLEAGPVREELNLALATWLLRWQRMVQAAKLAEGMGASPERTRIMKRLQQSWRQAQPEAEAAWRAGLSTEDQALLAAPLE